MLEVGFIKCQGKATSKQRFVVGFDIIAIIVGASEFLSLILIF